MPTRSNPSPKSSRPRVVAMLCAAVSTLALLAPPARAQDPARPAGAAAPHDGLHDFDFVIGRWKAHLRKLLHPLTGSAEWVEYDGTSVMTKLWGERANMEEFDVASTDPRAAQRPRIEAQTLRLYDPASHRWSIYGIDAAKGMLGLPATIGAFTDGRGEFFDWEEFDGRSILVRYVWTHPTADTAHMEQSFSADWGRTWEVNWICDLTPPAR
jgi:hypothetical protein